jgi:hypothetical protein
MKILRRKNGRLILTDIGAKILNTLFVVFWMMFSGYILGCFNSHTINIYHWNEVSVHIFTGLTIISMLVGYSCLRNEESDDY